MMRSVFLVMETTMLIHKGFVCKWKMNASSGISKGLAPDVLMDGQSAPSENV